MNLTERGCYDVDYMGSKNEIDGKLSARTGVGEKELAEIESDDVRQCRTASSSVESDQRKMRDGVENPMPEDRDGILMRFISLKVSEAPTDHLWLLMWHQPGWGYIGNFPRSMLWLPCGL